MTDVVNTDRTSVFERRESAVRSYSRVLPGLFDTASGSILRDVQRHASTSTSSPAPARSTTATTTRCFKQALLDYIVRDGITHSLDMHTAAKERFLEALQDIILAPRGLDYKVQFTGPTGTNAVEAALKLARKVTGRETSSPSPTPSTAMSLGALAVTGNCLPARRPPACRWPHDADAVRRLLRRGRRHRRRTSSSVLDDPSSGVDKPGGRDRRDGAGRGRPQRRPRRVAAAPRRLCATSAASC